MQTMHSFQSDTIYFWSHLVLLWLWIYDYDSLIVCWSNQDMLVQGCWQVMAGDRACHVIDCKQLVQRRPPNCQGQDCISVGQNANNKIIEKHGKQVYHNMSEFNYPLHSEIIEGSLHKMHIYWTLYMLYIVLWIVVKIKSP